jgi:hypothetical protein
VVFSNWALFKLVKSAEKPPAAPARAVETAAVAVTSPIWSVSKSKAELGLNTNHSHPKAS